jgi:predicted transcriptional regulator
MTLKEHLRKIADSLPDDATLDDAMERLYLLYKIQEGLEQDERGEGIPHEEVEKLMRAKWPNE